MTGVPTSAAALALATRGVPPAVIACRLGVSRKHVEALIQSAKRPKGGHF